MESERRVADYFIISGISDNFEHNLETKPLINSVLPITDVAVIFKGLGEQCPVGYTCIENTPSGHVADLNNGNFKSPNIHICYRRGTDKPPLIEVGVYHEDKDRILQDVEIVSKTPYGRSASTGNNSSKSGTFITYRRAKTQNPYNQLVVVDLCIILNNKSEHAPHAFFAIKKNLNKSYYGMIGSEVFLCYKKTFLSPPSLCYKPQIVSRFPLQDYTNFPLPDTVPLFCLPAGANIELRPANTQLPRPVYSTFVLTAESFQKIYGSALTFYEPFDHALLTSDQKARLGITCDGDEDAVSEAGSDTSGSQSKRKPSDTFAVKSICLLSRWPFFECFENYLMFLHRLVFNPAYLSSNKNSPTHKGNIALEHHISHFLLDVSFPTPQRPTVMIQLMPGTDENVIISQPSSRLPLPLTGASFIQLLSMMGVENTMNVLLFGLCEQKILLHSLNLWALTGVAEAITAMLFPFHWQCPYVPLCPLSLHGIINAPLPFIVGIDSRCFDTFTPPDDVICVDLDTQSIFLSDSKKCLNARILPKRAARVLRNSLDKTYQKWIPTSQAFGANLSPQHRSPLIDSRRQQLELEIQEAFVRFMVTILRGFRSFLLPITRAPTVGATDPTSLFNFEGFLSSRDRSYSQFYQLITRTQMFTHYIEERSFVSDKDTSLAFFDVCEEKLTSTDDIFSDKPIKLFDKDDGIIPTDRSVFIPAPEQSPSVSLQNSIQRENSNSVSNQSRPTRCNKFGPLNPALFHRHPQIGNLMLFDSELHGSKYNTNGRDGATALDKLISGENPNCDLNNTFSISRRTKQEIKTCQKMARKSADSPIEWAKYLVSCCYCLWFSTLPAYTAFCRSQIDNSDGTSGDKSTARILRYAFSTIVRMQKMQLTTDEICFRILTLLCGSHGQPALAVRVFFEMKKAGIKPNAVTYGYYNKAVLESQWPDHSSKPTTVLWTKIRNVISGIAIFKLHGRMRKERRNKSYSTLVTCDPIFSDYQAFQFGATESFEPTTNNAPLMTNTYPAHQDLVSSFKNAVRPQAHRRSLVNRSFSTHQKSTIDVNGFNYQAGTDQFQSEFNNKIIHKSYSMHLRRDPSPERGSLLRMNSQSLSDDEEEEPMIPQQCTMPQMTGAGGPELAFTQDVSSTQDLFLALMERHQILHGLGDSDQPSTAYFDIADNSAGLLFSTNPEIRRKVTRSVSQSLINRKDSGEMGQHGVNQSYNLSLMRPELVENSRPHCKPALLNASRFGEDARILRKIDDREQQPNLSNSLEDLGLVDSTRVHENAATDHCDDHLSDNNARGMDQMSESPTEPSQGDPNDEDETSAKNITSTPNFKLTSLINDASNLQWSRWTSSQNSKSVYKGIKSAATGIVSQLQEIKSSFSMSNSATPSKLLNTAQHKSMLAQWANYFSSQPSRADDDDSVALSEGSNDLFRLSNEEDIEPSSTEATDFRECNKLFDALEKLYSSSNSKEDLIDHLSVNDESSIEYDEVAIEIKLTTCSRCNVCHSLLYDEEIMERWSYNESNLNTRCVYCRAKIVPLMSIEVSDYRFKSKSELDAETIKKSKTGDPMDPDKDQLNEEGSSCSKRATDSSQQNLTVPYLSPIVLRKELETVFESSGDNCPVNSRFIDEHPIIFWNLLWYFSRINVPTHLALLCLESKSILNGRELKEEMKKMRKVVVRTLWDNDKLYSQVGKPLYRLLNRTDPSLLVQATLGDDLHFTRNFLEKVINLIRNNELRKAMNLVLNARLKGSPRFSFDKNRHNLYRDLVFLINTYYGPGKLYMDNFEREYKKAFESLNFQQVALNRFDRPPTLGSLYCRKCFKELSLMKRG